MVRIFLRALKFRGEGQKKKEKRRYSARNLRLQSRSFFVLEQNFSHAGGTQASNCSPVAPGRLISFGAQSSLGAWGHTSRLGAYFLLACFRGGGARPRNALRGVRPGTPFFKDFFSVFQK